MYYGFWVFAAVSVALTLQLEDVNGGQKVLKSLETASRSIVGKDEAQIRGAKTDKSAQTKITNPTTRKLTGRFLQITDIHPDPFYKTYSSTDEEDACHRGKGVAGHYGAESSDCDSPMTLVNATFEWIKNNLRDEVDFVIWTGDSARHDNDLKIPRDRRQVVGQNTYIVEKFIEAFGKKENWDDDDPTNDFIIPIVPTLGNNDVLPHNIFIRGPNAWTKRYLDVWRQFIPEAQRHQFDQGGWFSVEVIPQRLAVISLNTLFFFSSNSGVDGCAAKRQPGYEQFDWLRIQLDILRSRGMKAIIMGHVPPARVEAKVSWDETCWQKYTLWMHQYRDVVIAGLYGHMNIDHFMLQDYEAVKPHVRKGVEYLDEEASFDTLDDEMSVTSAQDYLQSLRTAFSRIPSINPKDVQENGKKHPKKPRKGKPSAPDYRQIGGPLGERYALTFVSPSIVPNYFPTLRIYSYNISGLEQLEVPASSLRPTEAITWPQQESHNLELRSTPIFEAISSFFKRHRKQRSTKAPRKVRFTVPAGPLKTTPPGPAYLPQPLTITSYTQYFANLTYINNDFTHDLKALRWKPGKHQGKKPKHPKPRPFNVTFKVEYDTKDDKVYKLKDLTTRSMLDLAARIADKDIKEFDEVEVEGKKSGGKNEEKKKKHHKKKKNKDKTWRTFVTRAFVGVFEPDELNILA